MILDRYEIQAVGTAFGVIRIFDDGEFSGSVQEDVFETLFEAKEYIREKRTALAQPD